MQISATIFDWTCQVQLTQGLWNLNDSQGGTDSFTLYNDSVAFNDDFGSLFLRARNLLPPRSAEVLERFLVNFCPQILTESPLQPDYDLDSPIEWVYSALSPVTVRSRLASLLEIDLGESLSLFAEEIPGSDVVESPIEIANFIFMWAAAHGQAASKNWGLVVTAG